MSVPCPVRGEGVHSGCGKKSRSASELRKQRVIVTLWQGPGRCLEWRELKV